MKKQFGQLSETNEVLNVIVVNQEKTLEWVEARFGQGWMELPAQIGKGCFFDSETQTFFRLLDDEKEIWDEETTSWVTAEAE